MHSFSSTVLSALLLASQALASPAHRPSRQSLTIADGNALRVLPLGASITYGTNSGAGNGYRKFLRDQLRITNNVNMIGSQHGGTMCDNEVEGWPGYIIDQIKTKAALSAPDKPNLILINAGTNDCVQNVDLANINTRMASMLDYLYSTAPGTTIVLSTLLHNGNADTNKRVVLANSNFTQLVTQRQAAGDKIVLADMYNDGSGTAAGPTPDEITDGTHPNDAGYLKMANIWYTSIKQASSKGWITKAAAGLPDSGDSDDCSSASRSKRWSDSLVREALR